MALVIGLTITSWSLAGCAAEARAPEPLPLDRVECSRCRMLVSTESGSAQIVAAADETRFYDDIGCLAADWPATTTDATPFVQVSGGWGDARTAFFAQPAAARTAMGSGFVAYSSAAEARAADGSGRALTWDEVVELAGEGR